MLKKILLNNLIALLVHVKSIVLFIVLMLVTETLISPASADVICVVTTCISIILYVLCGFILKPVEKFSFLSVVSVAIVLAVILAACIRPGAIDEYGEIVYLYFNPFLFPLTGLFFREPKIITYPMFLLSPVYPSLLMYLGMIIRRKTASRRKSTA